MVTFAPGNTLTLTLDYDDYVTFSGAGNMTVTPYTGSPWQTYLTGNQVIGPFKTPSTTVVIDCKSDGSYTQASNTGASQRLVLSTDPAGNFGLIGNSGKVISAQFPIGVPSGMSWFTDTISGVDPYALGFVKTPTMFFDPTATTSKNFGTYRQPYNDITKMYRVLGGDLSRQVLGIKRGTVTRTPSGSSFKITGWGTASNPFYVVPYGDADALPVINGCISVTGWTLVDATNNIWSYPATSSDIAAFQSQVRLIQKPWSTSAVATLTVDGTATWNSNLIYVRPFNGTSPTGIEIFAGEYGFYIEPTNSATEQGHIIICGMDVFGHKANSIVSRAPASSASITAFKDVQVVGCKVHGVGSDTSNATYSKAAISLFGISNTVRLQNSYVAGVYGTDILNNTVEYVFTDGAVQEFTRDYRVGGNIAELYQACSNSVIRYNYGEYHDNTYWQTDHNAHSGLVWGTVYRNSVSDYDQTANVNNLIYMNLGHNCATHGIELQGGTGHVIAQNTLINDVGYSTNRLIEFGTNCPVTGSISCTISNNLLVASDVGNRVTMDVMQGTATNQVSISVTSTLTGNNNYHSGGSSGGGRSARVNNVAKFATTSGDFGAQSVWSAATTPFDTACIWTAPGVRAAIDSTTFKPTSLSTGIYHAGITGLSIGTKFLDGMPYEVDTTPTIGAYNADS